MEFVSAFFENVQGRPSGRPYIYAMLIVTIQHYANARLNRPS